MTSITITFTFRWDRGGTRKHIVLCVGYHCSVRGIPTFFAVATQEVENIG